MSVCLKFLSYGPLNLKITSDDWRAPKRHKLSVRPASNLSGEDLSNSFTDDQALFLVLSSPRFFSPVSLSADTADLQ